MKISGFTIARNVLKFNYPVLESIRSILPICDEFIVNVGKSEDGTLDYIRSVNSPKLRIIETEWDFSQKAEVLSIETNRALAYCEGDWAFYLQTDEVVHEHDLPRLKSLMQQNLHNENVDALRFQWFHFYGSYYRYRIDRGWYQKQDRIIRNNGTVESFGDAYGFQRKDRQELRRKNTGCYIYHYGWVQPQDIMAQRRTNAEEIGFVRLRDGERDQPYDYGDLRRFYPYFGTHPQTMEERIRAHALSQGDKKAIERQYWWHPMRLLRARYKTGRRVKQRIE